MQLLPNSRSVFVWGAVILTAWVLKFMVTLYRHRRRTMHLPGPPYHWLFGHLFVGYKMVKALPHDTFPHHYWDYLKKEYDLGDFFYFDSWPLGPTILVICDAEIADQITVKHSLPKHHLVKPYLAQHVGPDNLAAANGLKWKKARTIYNPGFATSHLIAAISSCVEDVMTYRVILNEHCDKGDVFDAEETAMKLTFDITGKLAMNMTLNSQRGANVLVDTFRKQLHAVSRKTTWTDPFLGLNPIRKYRIRQNSKLIDQYLADEIDRRFSTDSSSPETKESRRYIMDMSLDAYKRERDSQSQGMDAEFRKEAVALLRTFLFAGHDTVSTAISTIYYFLSKYPEVHNKACVELDAVFGPSIETTAELIKNDPHVLNRLPYNLGMIKEVLRLFPPAQTMRSGEKGIFIQDRDGNKFPTHDESWVVWPDSYIIGRNPRYFPDPDLLIPERHMEGSPYPPVKPAAFRAFERGPRACVGGEFGLLGIKLVMALTLRSFSFEPAYPQDAPHIDGEKCYQVLFGSAKPKSGIPMRVKRRQ